MDPRIRQLRAEFRRVLRAAVKQAEPDGWQLRSSSLTFHAASGHWGVIAFNTVAADPLPVEIDAGALSPLLLRVVNQVDPSRPPPRRFVTAHAPVLLQFHVQYDGAAGLNMPKPLWFPRYGHTESGIVLGPESSVCMAD